MKTVLVVLAVIGVAAAIYPAETSTTFQEGKTTTTTTTRDFKQPTFQQTTSTTNGFQQPTTYEQKTTSTTNSFQQPTFQTQQTHFQTLPAEENTFVDPITGTTTVTKTVETIPYVTEQQQQQPNIHITINNEAKDQFGNPINKGTGQGNGEGEASQQGTGDCLPFHAVCSVALFQTSQCCKPYLCEISFAKGLLKPRHLCTSIKSKLIGNSD